MQHTRFALYVGPNGRKKIYPLTEDGEAPQYVDCFDGTRLPLVMTSRYEAGVVRDAELESDRQARRIAQESQARRIREWNLRHFGRRAS